MSRRFYIGYFGIFNIDEGIEDELHSQGKVTIENPKGDTIKLVYVGDTDGDKILNKGVNYVQKV